MTQQTRLKIDKAKLKYNFVKCLSCKTARRLTSYKVDFYENGVRIRRVLSTFICKNKQCKDYGK